MLNTCIIYIFLLFNVWDGNGGTENIADQKTLEYIQLGNKAYQNERYHTAIEQYLNAVFLGYDTSNDFAINFKLGRSYFETGNYDESLIYFDKTTKLDNLINDYINLFIVKNLVEKNELNQAVKTLESILTIYPNTKLREEIQYLLGSLYERIGEWEKSNRYWQTLANRKSNKSRRPEFWYRMAENHFQLENAEKAVEYLNLSSKSSRYRKHEQALSSFHRLVSYRDSLKLKLTEDEILNGVATLTRHKKFDEGFKWINHFFKAYKDTSSYAAEAYYRLGNLFYSKRSYYVAILNFRKVIELFPKSRYAGSAHYNIARAHQRQGKNRESIRHYINFVENHHKHSMATTALWQVGWLYERQKKNLKAAAIYEKLYTEYPRSGYRLNAKWRRGFCFYKAGQYISAETVFQYIKKHHTRSGTLSDRCTFWIGKCYERRGDLQKAESVYQTLIENPEDNYYRMLSYKRWGRDKQPVKNNNNIQLASAHRSIGINRAEIEDTKLQKTLTIYDLIGETYAIKELKGFADKNSKNTPKLKQMLWVCEKLGLYGEAFRARLKLSRNLKNENTGENNTEIFLQRYPIYYSEFVNTFARMYSMDSNVLFGIIRRESLFDRMAVSWVGAKGVMQIMPYTGKAFAEHLGIESFSEDDLHKPEVSILMGAKHMAEDLKRFDNQNELALAAYNAGFGAVRRWIKWYGLRSMDEFIENISYTETRNYVKIVMHNYWMYEMIYN